MLDPVRRVIPLLLALVLLPSTAMASWYRCSRDGVTRSSCCCQTKASHAQPPTGDAAVHAACCCEVMRLVATAGHRTSPGDARVLALPPVAPVHLALPAIPVLSALSSARPLRLGVGPPGSLFARHCALLL